MTNTTENKRHEILIQLRDPGHILSNFDADTISYLKELGLKIIEEEGEIFVEALVDVTNIETLKISEKTVDSTLRNIETTFLHANITDARANAKEYHEQRTKDEKQKRSDLKSKLSSDYKSLEFEIDESGDILIDFTKSDVVFEKGDENTPASKAIAFDEKTARETATRMLNERDLRLKAEREIMLDISYDIISKHQFDKVIAKIGKSENPYDFHVGGVNINNRPRNFALNKNDLHLYGKEKTTNLIREVVIAESDRHFEVLAGHFMSFGILFLKSKIGHGVHVGYWHQNAFLPEREQYWRDSHPIIKSYKEAAIKAQWLLEDKVKSPEGEGGDVVPNGSPNVVKSRGRNQKPQLKKSQDIKNATKRASKDVVHGFIINTDAPAASVVAS